MICSVEDGGDLTRGGQQHEEMSKTKMEEKWLGPLFCRRCCNLDQNDAQSADCPHNIQGANFPAAWKSNGNWQKNLKLSFLQSSSVSCYLPPVLTGSYVAPITPAHPSVCWSGVGGRRKPKWQRSVSLSPAGGTGAHILVWAQVWIIDVCSRFQSLLKQMMGGGGEGLKFHESAVEHFSWIRHNCWRRIILERRHLNASGQTQWSDKQPHQTCLKITC